MADTFDNSNYEFCKINQPKFEILHVYSTVTQSVSEFNEFKPRLKSAKNRFQFSAGLNLKRFNKILSETNHI